MSDNRFEALIARLERQARDHPGAYRLKVLLLAALGNIYVLGMLAVIVVLLAVLVGLITVLKAVAVKLIALVGFFLWTVVKALWVKLEPPTGTEITADQAPELFALVDDLRRRLGAPRFHHVLITDDFNAGVVQSPRLGLFGWPRNYLLLGLPLMKALTDEQFKAVLAHELGHLAKGHGRMSNWIYRQRLRWSRLLAILEASASRGGFLFKPFLRWFSPYFSAYSFPMARANEYEADAASAQLASPQAAAEALTGVDVVGSFLAERYWPGIHQQADELPQPSFAPYSSMGRSVVTDLDAASVRAWLDQAMARQTGCADTHPALADRLRAIGETPRLALPEPGQAADRLLGAGRAGITESFDRRWHDNIAPAWQERHREMRESRRQLAELNARHDSGAELTVQEAYDRARLTDSVANDLDAALAQFRALHEQVPGDATVCFSLGVRLLRRDDAAGCGLIEQAMRVDENAIVNGCQVLRDYHWRAGNKPEADAWHQRMVERVQLQEAAALERDRIWLSDRFEPHGLADEAIAELRRTLAAIPGLHRTYLARKRVKHLPHRPCYVLGYRVDRWYQWHSKARARDVLQRIQETVRLPGETLLVNVEGDNRRFGGKFRRLRGARIV